MIPKDMPLIACIDMEGVLIPEMWPHLAGATGIEALKVTTREVKDYGSLVTHRIEVLRSHGLRLGDIQNLVAELDPLPGAVDFLERLRQSFDVMLVSDAFEEMVQPLWRQLGCPKLFCHRLECDEDGFIRSPRFVRQRGKHEVVEMLSPRCAWTLAVGDAFNDLGMLRMASKGLLFRPSPQTAQAATDIVVVESYEEILDVVAPLLNRRLIPLF